LMRQILVFHPVRAVLAHECSMLVVVHLTHYWTQ
jgi:hypothetical protein